MNKSVREIVLAMQENWPECAATMSVPLLKITRIQDIYKKKIDACIVQYQLQHTDFSVLATLRRSATPYCLSPTDLYKSMFFSSGGLTKVLGRLVEAGLIERLDNPEDKRSKLVKLSIKGKQLVEIVMPELHKQHDHLLQGLSAQEITLLDSLLGKILENHE
ncbi:MarR family winged helix-turn-helix transcriptional regulator [Psychromonas sp. Urea-02u-13]|uniref:MarR family winged helix-turn-helix transcriptional regulator n=1 Tax=Psychromonas sp. Urea-02u-13 TaxID=2058326 RepID=UPI000C32DEE3|nr:MarR family transcriptional regulator [Psychromonas sp. Urea-02u-13]PKG37291.1 transcriptional regulator [Psychromonas sp. Urea-02u-13]